MPAVAPVSVWRLTIASSVLRRFSTSLLRLLYSIPLRFDCCASVFCLGGGWVRCAGLGQQPCVEVVPLRLDPNPSLVQLALEPLHGGPVGLEALRHAGVLSLQVGVLGGERLQQIVVHDLGELLDLRV